CRVSTSIAFIIRSCDALDIKLHLQYNESVEHSYEDEEEKVQSDSVERLDPFGVTIVSISGMNCATCTSSVESALKEMHGISEALVSLPLQEARVLHEPSVRQKDIIEAIETVKYDAVAGERATEQKINTLRHTEELTTLRESLKGLSLYLGAIFTLGTLLDYSGWHTKLNFAPIRLIRPIILFGLTLVAASKHGHWIFHNAATAARYLRVKMHTLITASTAVGLSLTFLDMLSMNARTDALYFDTIVGVLLIVTVGRYLNVLSSRGATDTFAGLYSLMDQTSNVNMAKLNKRVSASMVRPGDEIIISAFNIAPCDCYVVSGKSHVNEAVITGESLPKSKEEGDLLLAGSRNGPAQLRARVTQDPKDSFLTQLHRIDVITQYFVSGIFAIAIPTAVYNFATTFRAEDSYIDASDAAGRKLMTILAAACPCALGLASPCAVMVGIDVSWRRVILMLEGGDTMGRLQTITHIVKDKNGTLTKGTHSVTDITFQDVDGVLKLLDNAGRGVKCEIDPGDGLWRTVSVGNLAWMKENNVKGVDLLPWEFDREGSVDVVRPDAKATIDDLKAQGLTITMLMGDQPAEACRISNELRIPVMGSAATPDVKVKHIKSIQEKGGKVLMIGDGMNDGPSLATADVGVMISNGRKCLTSGERK
ncbi:heavy metal translocating P-type ATPase, partial [Paraphaeosphaeria minitans]